MASLGSGVVRGVRGLRDLGLLGAALVVVPMLLVDRAALSRRRLRLGGAA